MANGDTSGINVAPLVEQFGQRGAEAAVTAAGGDLSRLVLPQASPTEVQIEPGDTVPDTAITGTTTRQDVLNERQRMEDAQTAQTTQATGLNQFISGLQTQPQTTDFISGLIFPDATPLQQQQEQLVQQQQGLIGQVGQRIAGMFGRDTAGRLEEIQAQAGIPQAQEEVAASNVRLAELQGQLQTIRPQIETEAGQTRIGAEARLGPVERNLRAEIASEAILQSALAGNLQALQNNANQLLELELGDENRELQLLQTQLNLAQQQIQTLDPALQREAEQRATALQFAVTERQNALQTQAQNRQTVVSFATQALQNGAPGELAKQAMLAGTPEQAAALLAPYLKDPLLNLKRQEIEQSIANMQASRVQAGLSETLDGKPQNATQARAESFGQRLLESGAVIDDLGEGFTGTFAFGGVLPNILQSANRQQFEQAKRNFINAVLRQESGAAIAQSEFDNAEKQYFPTAGDSPEVVLQKRMNRNTVINNFYREANKPRPVSAGDIIEDENGNKFRVAEDGVTLEKI